MNTAPIPQTSTTTHCGLNHTTVYRRNTGKMPNARTLIKLNRSCDAWHSSIERNDEHKLTSLRWHYHMNDLGANDAARRANPNA